MNKACPVVLRKENEQIEFLAFRHPLAGMQIVKGSIEGNESIDVACERELFEESGLIGKATSFLGVWDARFEGQVWGFYRIELLDAPAESWVHQCLDDGGHDFEFFWQPLYGQLDDNWHPLFQGAIEFIRTIVQSTEI